VPPLSSSQGIIRFGDFDVDPQSGELRKRGKRIKLQIQPFQVLQILLEHPGEVVTREELQKRIWPGDTFVDFDQGLNNAVKKLREALGDDAGKPRFVETLSKRGYRFISPIKQFGDGARFLVRSNPGFLKLWIEAGVAVAVLVIAVAGGLFWRSHKALRLTDKDTIVLADFANSTGDAVFDESLKRALAAYLQQSPFLGMLSDQQVQQTLRLMGRPPNTKLSQDITREVCQRNQATATIGGTISAVGSQYLITLDAINCVTGASLTQVGANATNKGKVLQALGQAASELRKRLGESLASIEKYDAPLEQATTSSMEALKMYSLGLKAYGEEGSSACIPYFRRAIELDPNFASAYALAAVAYWNVGESSLASEYVKPAYELRDRVTELERLHIESQQFLLVTGVSTRKTS